MFVLSVDKHMMYSTIQAWCNFLEQRAFFHIDLGLQRMHAAIQALGLDRKRLAKKAIVTVAGTNGKGTTVALLATLLRKKNYRVGAYYSPHVFEFNERMQCNLMPISERALLRILNKLGGCLIKYRLTYFEFITLVALDWFSQLSLDYLILEIGLGGRLDAVNAIDPDLAIITNISLDHCQWLGSTREVIAKEKAGIIRNGISVIFAERDLPKAIKAIASEKKAPLFLYGKDFVCERSPFDESTSDDDIGDSYYLKIQGKQVTMLKTRSIAPEQIASVSYAYFLLEKVLPDKTEFQAACLKAITGRCQLLVGEGKKILWDVAHNPAAMLRLIKKIQSIGQSGRVRIVFSVLADKDLNAMLACFKPNFSDWYIAPLANVVRGIQLEALSAAFNAAKIQTYTAYKTLQAAYTAAYAISSETDLLVVTGSFYVLSELNAVFKHDLKARLQPC